MSLKVGLDGLAILKMIHIFSLSFSGPGCKKKNWYSSNTVLMKQRLYRLTRIWISLNNLFTWQDAKSEKNDKHSGRSSGGPEIKWSVYDRQGWIDLTHHQWGSRWVKMDKVIMEKPAEWNLRQGKTGEHRGKTYPDSDSSTTNSTLSAPNANSGTQRWKTSVLPTRPRSGTILRWSS